MKKSRTLTTLFIIILLGASFLGSSCNSKERNDFHSIVQQEDVDGVRLNRVLLKTGVYDNDTYRIWVVKSTYDSICGRHLFISPDGNRIDFCDDDSVTFRLCYENGSYKGKMFSHYFYEEYPASIQVVSDTSCILSGFFWFDIDSVLFTRTASKGQD